MSVTIEIVPSSNTVDMYGEPDVSSAYALSGHVEMAIRPQTFSLFGPRQTRLLLRSLTLTFEGQCEIINPKSGYSATRLCTVTRELLNSWRELCSDGQEESRWDITYNIPIPGWLPATSLLGYDNDGGVQYFAYATAEFTTLDDGSLWHMCLPFRSQVWHLNTRKDIILRRLMIPSATLNSFPESHFFIGTDVATQNEEQSPDAPSFPTHVLRHIQALASIPGYCNVDATESSIPLTLRLRAKDLSPEHASCVEITRLSVDVSQIQRCRHRTSREYASRFPLPSGDHQPPNEPLRNPHPISAMFELGFYNLPGFEGPTHNTLSMLPEANAGRFDLPDNTKPFVNADGSLRDDWYSLDVSVPYTTQCPKKTETVDWAGDTTLRPSQATPLFYIRHELKLSLYCSYRSPSGLAMRKVTFIVPLRFADVACSPSTSESVSNEDSSFTSDDEDESFPLLSRMPDSRPYVQPLLPGYSTLYDSNGQRKVDYSDFLPVYSSEAL